MGVGGIAKKLRNSREVMNNFLHENDFNEEYKLKGHAIPAGGIKRKIISNRVILSGDSAGFVDSFYGEGIAYAIRSGQIAADVLSDIIQNESSNGSLVEYEKRCKEEFHDNLRYSLVLSKMMHRFPNVFFRVLTSNDQVLDKYLEVPALKCSYKEFIKWLVPRVPKYLLGL